MYIYIYLVFFWGVTLELCSLVEIFALEQSAKTVKRIVARLACVRGL
jgi:hypothetical protein